MFERIVVALDGSQIAERVLPRVEALAQRFGSTVTLVQATTSPGAIITGTAGVDPMGEGVIDPTPIIEAERDAVSDYLNTLASQVESRGVKVETAEPEGAAARALLDHAEAIGADLIAMTTHGRSGFGRLVFGSVADEVLRHSNCPILLVRVSDES